MTGMSLSRLSMRAMSMGDVIGIILICLVFVGVMGASGGGYDGDD
jgi:hypothetical protein